MLSKEIIAQIQKIQLKAGHLVTDALAGEYSSAFKGLGIELEKVREYTEGDDIRAIDWNVTARMNAPFVKIYKEERELTVMLMVDVSASLRFGTSGRFKNEIAAELAAILAFLATKNNDKIGLILFSDEVDHYIPPQKGRAHIWRIIRTILTHETKPGAGTDLKKAFDFMASIAKRKTMCFLLSDFYDEGFEKGLRQIKSRHDVVCARLYDKAEEKIPSLGLLSLRDPETSEEIVVDTSSKSFRESFSRAQKEEKEKLSKEFRRNRIDFFEVSTSESPITPLVQYIRRRERTLR